MTKDRGPKGWKVTVKMPGPWMKAYRAKFEGDEWCTLVHGETRGKAKARFMMVSPEGCDRSRWNEIRLKRVPGLDDKPINFENSATAGFWYLREEDGEPDEENREGFINDCDCPVCKWPEGRRVKIEVMGADGEWRDISMDVVGNP